MMPSAVDRLCRVTLAACGLLFLVSRVEAQEAAKPSPFTWLSGHDAAVYAVAWSPDGKTLLSGSVDGSIGVWDATTGKLIRTIRDAKGAVLTLAPARDNLRFAAAGIDRKVRLYDIPSSNPLFQIPSVPGVPSAVAVSPDAKLIFSADAARYIRLWNVDTAAIIRDFPGSSGDVTGLAILPETKTILGSSRDGFVRSWNIDTAAVGPFLSAPLISSMAARADGKLLVLGGEDGVLRVAAWPAVQPQNLATYGDAVTSATVSPDGKYILVGAFDSQVVLYNAADGLNPRTLAGQPGKTTAVAISSDSALAASGSDLGNLKFWQVADGADRTHVGGHVGPITGLAFHPKDPQVATTGADGTVRVWSVPAAAKQLPGHSAAVQIVATDRKGTLLATAAGDKSVRLYQATDGTAVRAIEQLAQPASALAFSDDAALLAIGDLAGNVRIEAAADGKNPIMLGAHTLPVTGLAFHPDGKRLVSVGHDGSLKFWTIPAAAAPAAVAYPEAVQSVALSADGKLGVAGSADGTVQMFDPANPKAAKKIEGPGSAVTSVGISPDAALVASASNAGVVRFTNAADGADRRSVAGHLGAVNAIAFAPNKIPQIATGSADGTARVWKFPVAPVPVAGHQKAVQAVAATADGKLAVTTGADGVAQVVSLPDGKPLRKLAGTEAALHSAALKKDGAESAVGDALGVIRLHNPADGALRGAFGGHEGPVTGIAYHPTQPLIASVGADGTAKLWQLPLVPAVELVKHAEAVTALVLSADGATVVSTGADKAVRVHAANAARQLGPNLVDVPRSLALSGDNAWVAVGTDAGGILLLNVADGAVRGTFGGHTGAVSGVAIHPNNMQVASAGADGTLRLWEITPAPVVLGGHGKPLTAVALSPNGQWLATAAADNTVRLWNTANNTAGPVLGGHTAPVTAITWKADSAQIVTGSADKSVRVWTVADGKQVMQLDGSEGPVGAVAITPDGARVLAGGADKQIRVWTAADMKPAPAIAGHTDAITGLALIAGGATIVSSSKDGTIRTWAAADGKPGLNINAGGPVNALAVSADEKLFAAAGQDKSVRLFNAADGKAGVVIDGAAQPVVGVAFSRDNLRVAATTTDGIVRVSDVTGKLLETVNIDKAPATAAAFGADNRTLFVAGGDNNARLVKLAFLRMSAAAAPMPLSSVTYTPDGNGLVTGGADKIVRLYNMADGAMVREYPGHTEAVTKVAVTKDAQKILAAGADKSVRVWKLPDAGALPAMTHPAPVRTLALNADGSRVVTGADDNSVRIWDVATGKLVERFLEPTKPVPAVGFPADGKTVVSGSADFSVRRHTLASKWFAAAHEGAANAVVFNADGAAVITAGADKLVKQFDANGAMTRQFTGAEAAVKSLALRPDGLQLSGGCENGQICQWTFANAALERKVVSAAAVAGLAYSADNTRLVAIGGDNHLRVYFPTDGLLLEDVTTAAPAGAVAFGPDASTVLVGQNDSAVVHSLSLVRHLGPHAGGVTAVAWSPDGATLFTGGADKAIIQWNLATGMQVRPFAGHADLIAGLAVSADGQRLISVSPDKSLRTWTIATGAALATLPTAQPLRSLSASLDGKRAVTLEDGNTLRTWDLVLGRELEHAVGHEGGTTRVAMSGDGKVVLSGGADKNARVWNLAAQVVVVADAMKAHDLAMLPDGSHVVTSGDDKTVKLWDLTGKLVRSFGGLQTPVKNVAVNQDGTVIAAGGDPQFTAPQLMAWKTADAAVAVNVTLPSPITSLAFNGDGRLAAGCVDKRLRSFAAADARLLEDSLLPAIFADLAILPDNQTVIGAGNDNFGYITKLALQKLLLGHTGAVNSVAYLPDGKHIVTSGLDKTVRQWNIAEGKVVRTFAGSAVAATGLGVSKDGKWLTAAGADNAARTWAIPAGAEGPPEVAATLTLMHPGPVRTAQFSPDGSRIVTAADDGGVRIWDSTSGKQLETLVGLAGVAMTATYSPDGKFVVTGGADKISRKFVPAVTAAVAAHEGRIADVKLSADGSTIYTAGADKTVASFSVEGLKAGPKFTGAEAPLRSVAVDGKTVAAGGEDKSVRTWNAADGKPLASVATPDVVTSVIVADDGRKIIAAGADKLVRNYGLVTIDGKPALDLVQEMTGHTAAVTALSLAADGKTLYSAGADQILRRWHAASYGPIQTLEGATGPVYSVEFSPDGKLLAGGGADMKVRVWNTADGKLAFAADGHTRQVNAVAFSPNGQELASAGLDATIRIWNTVPPPEPPKDGKPADPKAAEKPALGALLGEIKEDVDGPILTLMYSRDGNQLFSAGAGKSWQSWTRKDLKLGKSYFGHNQTIYRISYNPAGTRIATLDYSGNFVIWNAADAALVFHAQLPANTTYGFAYSPTGQEIAVGTSETKVLRFLLPQYAW